MSQTVFEAQLEGAAVGPDAVDPFARRRPRAPDIGRRRSRARLHGGYALLFVADTAAALAAPRLTTLMIAPAPTMATGTATWLIYGVMTVASLLACGFYRIAATRAPFEHAGTLLRALVSAHVLVLLRIALLRPAPTTLPLDGSIGWAAGVFGFAAFLLLGERLLIAAWWRHRNIAAPRGAAALVTTRACDRTLCARLDRLADHQLGYLFC